MRKATVHRQVHTRNTPLLFFDVGITQFCYRQIKPNKAKKKKGEWEGASIRRKKTDKKAMSLGGKSLHTCVNSSPCRSPA